MTRLHERTPTATGIVRRIEFDESPLYASTGLWGGLTSYMVRLVTHDDRNHRFVARASDRDEARGNAWVRIATGTFDPMLRPWQFTDPAIVIAFEPFPRAVAAHQRAVATITECRRTLAARLTATAKRLNPELAEHW